MTTTTDKAAKTWQQKRTIRLMTLSVTQLETFDLCRRKWWLERVRGLQVPSTGSQVFGTVLHSVIERFLKADDLGRDDQGNPVELYPAGWHIAEARFGQPSEGEVNPAEQETIRRLVTKAIEEGILERLPGRKIEKQFRRTLVQLGCPTCKGAEKTCKTCGGDGKGTHIQITGLLDCSFSDAVHDHKSVKKRAYIKSPNALTKSIQMLIYAKQLLLEAEERGEPLPATVTVRHNAYCKDPEDPLVSKVEATVTPREINACWKEAIDSATEMDRLRRTTERWDDVPDPVNAAKSCNAFGGCAFRRICTGRESEKNYEDRLAMPNNVGYDAPINNSSAAVAAPTINFPSKGITMGFEDRLAARSNMMKTALAASVVGAVAAAPIAPATPAPAQQTQVTQQAPAPTPTPVAAPAQAPVATVEVAAQAVGGDAPPWAMVGCRACSTSPGFNSKGNPCRVCDTKTDKKNNSSNFIVESNGDGTVTWINRTNTDWCGVSPLAIPTAPVQAQEKVALAAPVEAPVPAPAPAPAPVVVPPVQQAPAPSPAPVAVAAPVEVTAPAPSPSQVAMPAETEKAGPGRPSKGFVLMINCAPIKGHGRPGSGRNVIHLSDVFAEVTTNAAKSSNAESFYDLDPFKRKDALAKYAPALAEQFKNDIVVVLGLGQGQGDMRTLVDALRPLAGMEVVGVS